MESKKIKMHNINSIETISLNPFFMSLILQHFLSGYKEKGVEFNLIYLVLPIIFYKPSREFLYHANVKSSIFSMFLTKVESRFLLGGIQKRYFYFKELTNEALIVAANEEKISIDLSISLRKKADYKSVVDKETRDYFRAAYYLGVLFSKTNNVDLFRKLGVTNL